MKEVAVVLLSLVAASVAAYPNYAPYWLGAPYGGYPFMHAPYYGGYYGGYFPGHFSGYFPGHHNAPQKLTFYGKFEGTCKEAHDGLYYVDDRSFAFCSNGQKTIQPCAEGSANPAYSHFKEGDFYGFYDFCSVNLVAQGYGNYGVPPPVHEGYKGYKSTVYAEEKSEYDEER